MPNKNILPNDFYIENIQYICLFMHTYTFTFFLLCWVFVSMHRLSLVAVSRGYTLGAVHRLLIVGASLAAEHGLWGAWASVVVHVGLVAPWCVESSWTRDQTRVPCIGWWILNHWTTREVLYIYF